MTSKNIGFAIFGVTALAAAAPRTALADIATFNFEGLSTTAGGALTSLTFTSNGLTATLTRVNNTVFDITNQSAKSVLGFPASWGVRTLDPFADQGGAAFILSFSQAITSISIAMGDFGDDADALGLALFASADATGPIIGSTTGSLPAGGTTFTSQILTASAAGARSAQFIGGILGNNSVFYDNISATFTPTTTTPEPGTLALLAGGFIGIGAMIRKKKRNI